MLIIRKNEVNNPIATVSMNKTLSNPYYLFSFQHIASKERVSFVPQVITSNCRYDKFRFTETFSTNLSVTPPQVHFPYLGQYYYSIYEQIGSGNTDPALAYNKLESGRAVVIVGNDTINECLFEPYISNDEEFSNVIYVGDDEEGCVTPPTPTPTPTITQTPTPTPLPCFEQGTGFNGQTNPVLVENGYFLVGGGNSQFTTYNGISANNIIALNNDGSVYGGFNYGTGFNAGVSAIFKDSSGKYMIGGQFTTYNGNVVNRIRRLNPDGSIDNTFSAGTGVISIVSCFEQQPDGKYLVGGFPASYNGIGLLGGMFRVTSGGTLDTTFNVGSGSTGFNSNTSVIHYLDSGKILVGGIFTLFSGQSVNRIIRLNNNGSRDTTFNSGGSGFSSSVQGMVIQPDNKIICSGLFQQYNGQSSRGIIRLEEDGAIDTTFAVGTGFSGGSVLAGIALQNDGKILVGGGFTSYTGVYAGRIIRLETDGGIDSSFNSGTGFAITAGNAIVQKVNILSDGRIVCTGLFDSYNGTPVSNIAVLNPDGSLAECPAPSPTPTPTPSITPSSS